MFALLLHSNVDMGLNEKCHDNLFLQVLRFK